MKRYVLRKYVMAKNITEAIKKDRDTEVSDAWVDDKETESNATAIGFDLGAGYMDSDQLKNTNV